MSLSASMWTGVSGLLAHGEKMNVVGNNIANVSTVGFKGQRMDFADYVYQNAFSSAGLSQIGRGVKIGAIMGNFAQGPYESTTEATDLAINGRGFFQVQKVGSDQTYYTRAGNFRFNAEGYLMDPNGLALQGWKVDNTGGVTQAAGGLNVDSVSDQKKADIIGAGVPTDIKLDTWTVFPQQTTNIQFKVNLPRDASDEFQNQTNPFGALAEAWNGTQPPATPSTKPISATKDLCQTTMDVYDEAGSKHKITIYYDKVNKSSYENSDSHDVWEYIVTMDPAEDQRQFFDTATNTVRKVNETAAGGMLMAGTLTFNSSGALVNQTSYTWGGNANPVENPTSFTGVPDPTDPLITRQVLNINPATTTTNPNDKVNLNAWYPAAVSTNGLPLLVANFTGILDAQSPGSPGGSKYNIEMDFGLKVGNFTMPWENKAALGSIAVAPYGANPTYKPGEPASGPQFALLNTNYDPTADPLTSANAYSYQFSGITYPWTDPAAPADATALRNTLIQYKGANTVTVAKNSIALNDPPENITVTVNMDGTIPAGGVTVTLADGVTTYTLLDNAASQAVVDTQVNQAIVSNTVVDRSVLAPTTAADVNHLAEINKPVVIDAYACTSLGTSFTANQAQDGYGFGDLSSWMVDQQGVLYGVYSNGVTLPLWQVTLYDFNCTQGLRREGNNLFSQTRDSGEPKSGPAGVAGLGSISGYTLEQSNVDMSTEFVQMISTQRGFQANSKVITTTDVMLDTVINMKR